MIQTLPFASVHHGRMRADILATLLVGWRAMRRHRRRRKQMVALSRMPPRILCDMGLEPERIYETLDGTWDEVGPAHLSRLLRGMGKD